MRLAKIKLYEPAPLDFSGLVANQLSAMPEPARDRWISDFMR